MSTPVTVCENRYISSHKVAKAIASRGKSTKGWFYGFKLQGVYTKDGTLVKTCFRPGSKQEQWGQTPMISFDLYFFYFFSIFIMLIDGKHRINLLHYANLTIDAYKIHRSI
ncbi:transposase [Treponema sp.]|uniref:transposase n=1 Tax=Treponema sp. TaxID=166 RepID=UPI00298EBAC9|nr:transposase [Treponema sp.]MCQ2240077.1 transposase [Treponema sp.]